MIEIDLPQLPYRPLGGFCDIELAALGHRWDDLAALARREFGVVLIPETLRVLCLRHLLPWVWEYCGYNRCDQIGQPAGPGSSGWSRESWRMWLKVRVYEAGVFACELAVGGINPDAVARLTVTLHVFDIHWDPTPAMLARLRRREPKTPDRVARSKMFRDDNAATARPIDRTAAIVALSKKLKLNPKATARHLEGIEKLAAGRVFRVLPP